MINTTRSIELIERFCLRDDLATYDPYDIWKTRLGFWAKDLYNGHRWRGLGPVAFLALFDTFANNRARKFYSRQEYPIVRALAALSLLNVYRVGGNTDQLEAAKRHLQWLTSHACRGCRGTAWGMATNYAVSKGLHYGVNTPLATMTPYCLEAFVEYRDLSGDGSFDETIRGIARFLDEDLVVMEETDQHMAMSYAPMKDRIVVNAASYTMWAYALLLPSLPSGNRDAAIRRIEKLHCFVRRQQRPDGSWLYSPEGKSFIDCFHSCIVLKNLIKTHEICPIDGTPELISAGYQYLKDHLLDEKQNLYRRFSVANKPGIVKYDLYDNAEMLNLAVLMEDRAHVKVLGESIERNFHDGPMIFSQIDASGTERNRNMLRWAVMPYLHALSQIAKQEASGSMSRDSELVQQTKIRRSA